MREFFLISFLALVVGFFSSCEKNRYTTDPSDKLNFSSDTVQFDTIFTNIGSTTKSFTVKNLNSKDIVIDEILLAKGANSVFRMNVDGVQSNSLNDIEISAGDSIFIFVEVTINPSENSMVEQDSILFLSNGNSQDVDLVAFGQDVVLINGETLKNDTVWTSSKPFLVYNSVLVDENVRLQIEAGTQVHFHTNSCMLVKGTLQTNGTLESPVVFQGDRLEAAYDDISGQWGAWITLDSGGIYLLGGIHFLTGSKYNEMTYTEVKNGIIGVRADSVVTAGVPTVKMENCIIQHMNVAGLYAAGAYVTAENSIFSDCGQYIVALLYGGNYDFKHCTFSNYYSGTRQTSSVAMNNYFTYDDASGQTILDARQFSATFSNSIIYGSLSEELMIDGVEAAGFDYLFDHCLLKTGLETENEQHFADVIVNEDPLFLDKYETYDYRLDTLSPALNVGKMEIALEVPLDYDGISRTSDNGPDLGAFERIE